MQKSGCRFRAVEHFQNIREKTEGLKPFEKLEYLGNMTLDFLFEHHAVAQTLMKRR